MGGANVAYSILEASFQPGIIFDADTLDILAANEAASGLYGYSWHQFRSLSVPCLFPAEDLTRFQQVLKPRLSVHDQAVEGPAREGWRHRTRSGSVFEVAGKASAAFSLQGKRVRAAFMTDLTVERVLMRGLREVCAAPHADALGIAVHSLAHTVRTPLAAVSGIASTLGRNEVLADRELALTLIGRLQANVKRLEHMSLVWTHQIERTAGQSCDPQAPAV